MIQHFQKLRMKYFNAPKIHLILDQGSYNKSITTKQAAKKYNIVLHYLPPYSLNLNPIERLWKVMNEYARNNQFFQKPQQFKDSIMSFFNQTWNMLKLKMSDRINDNFQILKQPIV